MFLVPINISNFRLNPSKIFLRLLVHIKFSIITCGPYFYVNSCIFFKEIVHQCVEYCQNLSKNFFFLTKH